MYISGVAKHRINCANLITSNGLSGSEMSAISWCSSLKRIQVGSSSKKNKPVFVLELLLIGDKKAIK